MGRKFSLLAALLIGFLAMPAQAERSIAIIQFSEHPSLVAVRSGLKDELAAQGNIAGMNLEWHYASADGNPDEAAAIAQQFASMRPGVIVAIATPAAQAAMKFTGDIPLIFTAVTDPLSAGLVDDLKYPGGRVTGVMDLAPVDKHLAMIRRILPQARTLGVVFNPREANSVSLLQSIKQVAPAQGMSVVQAAATRGAEVLSATRSLVDKADMIYVPTDNTVMAAFGDVVRVGRAARLPVFAGDTGVVGQGAIAALGFNYYDVGRQTGRIVSLILSGQSPAEIPVQAVEKLELFVNPGAAEEIGLTLPADLIAEATRIVR